MSETTPALPAQRKRRTKKVGTVVSTKMEKTVVVEVTRTVREARYGRYMKQSKKFLADDRVLGARLGDIVEIEETRPLSARKRWRVRAIVKRSAQHVRAAAPAAAPGN
ncbi:MAG: 30S ribosomal protein S17 [Acidobacteria bacterium]|nr:30S ribosomal protein S17 [Acidobacteriota bacterium]MCG3192477.1 30S ribosomal protein S17 [Thermoanaerobaculia bacterium]MCK6683310.1 30S ribosomal protein S17 [Thermoanaerobaculia bacterium]